MNNQAEKIIVALDFDNYEQAKRCVDQLEDAVFFKVGLQAFIEYGYLIVAYLKNRKKKLFLDLKFKDIPNTVSGAVKSSLIHDPDFLTIHCSGGGEMIRQAVQAAQEKPGLTVLGVTVLTSLSGTELLETAIAYTLEATVLKLVELGLKNNLKSFVCSPLEVELIKKRFGADVKLVTPGIRPEWSEKGDQKRVFTPAMAIKAGCDYMVIGRPITGAEKPQQAFKQIVEEITGN